MPAVAVKSEAVFQSRRGIQLSTCSWTPSSAAATKALVFLCHGYGMECSVFMSKAGEKLAAAGYCVFGIDYEGHGKSDGMRCYIRRFDDIVDDCHDFFHSVRSRPEFAGKPAFLYGESMGGAVALLLERRSGGGGGSQSPGDSSNCWSGAILVAPMCKISENMLPTPWLRWLLIKLSALIPTWKVVPIKDVIEQSFKDERKRRAIRSNPYIYTDRMILKTAVELLLTSLSLEKLLGQVKMPFIVLHGEDDRVTDPAISKELYAAASSSDKTIRIYSGMWHGLTTGEPDHNVDLVFQDITEWLDKRCAVADYSLASLDGLKKLQHDPLFCKGMDLDARS
ncbi:hypothetical protein SELMODRAFT_97826 [Selaginella moellendorffii]|uniref:Serine aminopeptidase S33 domain-containing protein n=2 Tax=Selaginella moellendorffii TaxID=88036 RepID=D8RMU1_SELML|nr:hypothetical protein SELMODRAFT_97826 [Selaginella moellendorffii]